MNLGTIMTTYGMIELYDEGVNSTANDAIDELINEFGDKMDDFL